MEDLVLWPQRLPDLQEMEAEDGLTAQMDLILLEEQADGDRQDTLEDRLDSLRACQVVEHLHRVRQVFREDHQEDQDGLQMDRPTDLQMDRRTDLASLACNSHTRLNVGRADAFDITKLQFSGRCP